MSKIPGPWAQSQRELWRGAGEAWTMVTELLTATAVWGAIGFGLDRLFDTWPILFAVGAVVGHATGIYIVYRRYAQAAEKESRPGSRTSGVVDER